MKIFVHIPVAGPPVAITADEQHALRQLQGLVGGYIEGVTLRNGHMLYINEEGKLKGLPVNDVATDLARDVLSPWDVIVGDAVLVGPPDAEGGDTAVNPVLVATLTA